MADEKCPKCGKRLMLQHGFAQDFEADQEPFESDSFEDAEPSLGQSCLTAFACEECGHIAWLEYDGQLFVRDEDGLCRQLAQAESRTVTEFMGKPISFWAELRNQAESLDAMSLIGELAQAKAENVKLQEKYDGLLTAWEAATSVVDTYKPEVSSTAMLHDKVFWLGQQYEKLQGVLDKLPKTADGVSVVPGMTIFNCHGDEAEAILKAYEDGDWWWGKGPRAYFDECYSTKAAAEAAKGKEGE